MIGLLQLVVDVNTLADDPAMSRSEVSMKFRHIIIAAIVAMMATGTAFAGIGVPEIDPGMATGGLAIAGIGAFLLIERYRARR